MVNDAVQGLGGLDIVVCNAGRQQSKPPALSGQPPSKPTIRRRIFMTTLRQSCDHELRQILGEAAWSKGIRVNGVAPGPIWTPLQISGGALEEKYEKFGSTTVFGRPGQPAELASIYVQLAADDASFATGNIYGSGGGRANPKRTSCHDDIARLTQPWPRMSQTEWR